jgi:hypothetical protein
MLNSGSSDSSTLSTEDSASIALNLLISLFASCQGPTLCACPEITAVAGGVQESLDSHGAGKAVFAGISG